MNVWRGSLDQRSIARRGSEAQERFSVERGQGTVKKIEEQHTWGIEVILFHVGSCGGSPDGDKPAGSPGIPESDALFVQLSARLGFPLSGAAPVT